MRDDLWLQLLRIPASTITGILRVNVGMNRLPPWHFIVLAVPFFAAFEDDEAASPPPPPPASAGPTIEDRLNRLKRLRDKQDITPEEYEAKRRKILDEL